MMQIFVLSSFHASSNNQLKKKKENTMDMYGRKTYNDDYTCGRVEVTTAIFLGS